MSSKSDIHDFAVKYLKLFDNPPIAESKEINITGFIEQCFSLGLHNDYEKLLYGEGHSWSFLQGNEELLKKIEGIEDAQFLGTVIFYNLRGITYWLGEDPLDEEYRPWFAKALGRLASITEEAKEGESVFEGSLRKIRLVSSIFGFGLIPEPEIEIDQDLTITSDGRVYLSRYGSGENLIEKIDFSIPSEAAGRIMGAITDYFSGYKEVIAYDAPVWFLTLTNDDGKNYEFFGSVVYDCGLHELSKIIRRNLDRDDIYAFDGDTNLVTRVEIKYHRNTKKKTGEIGESDAWESRDYNEFLTIDRESGTLEHVLEDGTGCKVTNIYHMKEGVASFLNGISVDAFTLYGNEDDFPDAVDNPSETMEYTIKLYTRCGGVEEIEGAFYKDGLPEDWPSFIKDVYEFMVFYGTGELFDERVYGKEKMKQSDCIFCNVLFEEGGRTYCYLADSDDYHEGDLVVVPVGPDRHESVVRIESIEYRSINEAPFPIDKISHILRKYEKKDNPMIQPWIREGMKQWKAELPGATYFTRVSRILSMISQTFGQIRDVFR